MADLLVIFIGGRLIRKLDHNECLETLDLGNFFFPSVVQLKNKNLPMGGFETNSQLV